MAVAEPLVPKVSYEATGFVQHEIGSTPPELTYSYTCDAALRLASVNDSRGNKTIAYAYSPGGRLTRMTIDDVGPIDYRYDASGKLSTVWDPFDTIVFYQYDALRLRQRLLGNGTGTELSWNLDGTLAQLKNTALNPARQKLSELGISGNAPVNGVWLPGATSPSDSPGAYIPG